MIALRRAQERHHVQHCKQEGWLTFGSQDRTDPLARGFGTLRVFDESQLPPGGALPQHVRHEAVIITYVHEGALAHGDSTGRSGVVHAGEFHSMIPGLRIRHTEKNASRTYRTHVFQVWLLPSEAELAPHHEQKRFSAAERRGGLCIVASPDARRGSLRIHQDARMYSAILDPGQHVVHELSPGRGAWLHLVQGEVTLGDVVLTTGDGAGVTAERALSLTARDQAEILLLDVAYPLPDSAQNSGVW